MLQAAAGFGKSFLASEIGATFQYRQVVDCAVVRDAPALARAIVSAIAELVDRAGEVAHEQFATIDDPHQAIALAERLWRELDGEGILVFENAELLTADAERLDLMRRLMQTIPSRRTFMFCTRVRLAGITGRLGPDEVVAFSEDDLRFTEDEVSALLDPMVLTPRQRRRLMAVSGGWPIALRLFGHIALERDADGALDALETLDNQTLAAYVLEQILPSLDAPVQRGMLVSAALPEPTEADIRTYFGPGAWEVLDALRDPGRAPFVAWHTGGRIDVHPLIGTALRSRQPDDARAIVLATAEGYEASGERVRAAQLYFYLGDQFSAARALGPLEGYLIGHPPPAIGALLSSLDRKTLLAFPNVWQAAINYRAFRLDPEEWRAEALEMWRSLTEADGVVTWCGVAFNLGSCYNNVGRHEDVEALLRQLEDRFPGDPLVGVTLKMARTWVAVARGEMRDLPRALEEFAPLLADRSVRLYVDYDVTPRYERFVNGDLFADLRILLRSIEAGRSLHMKPLQVLTLIEAAFAAWFGGDDALLEQFTAELRALSDGNVEAGMRHFLDSVDGRGIEARIGGEKLNSRAYDYLIAASRSATVAEGRRLAAAALSTADEARQPAYQALARIALAILDPAQAEHWTNDARRVLAPVHLPALQHAFEAFAAKAPDLGVLTQFVRRYRALVDVETGVLVRLLDGTVTRAGAPVTFSERARDLIMLLASERRVFAVSELADALWPDSEGDRATNALRVSINRLRRALAAESVRSVPGGYVLAPEVEVDVTRLQEFVSRVEADMELAAIERARLATAFEETAPERLGHLDDPLKFAALRERIARLRARIGAVLAAGESSAVNDEAGGPRRRSWDARSKELR